MKISDILHEAEQTYISRDEKGSHAATMGEQFLRAASQEAYKRGRPNDNVLIKNIATKLVNRFANNVLASIDEQIKLSKMRTIDGGAE